MSASPAPQEQKDSSTAIKFQFCAECSNLLYPYEDKDTNTLNFKCRTCSSLEPATTACVYRNDLSEGVTETAGITQDVGMDPTLPRIQKPCPSCGENEAVFFQSQQRTAETGMKLYYVCCSCGNVWQ